MSFLRQILKTFKQSLQAFIEDQCTSMSAALAYYTVFSLPGLLFIVVTVAGLFFGAQNVETEVLQQIQGLLGQDTAGQVERIIEQAKNRTEGTNLPAIFGVVVLLFAATGAFAQLQSSLNTIWGVKADPERGDVRIFIVKRLLSFGMILGIAFLLLVSLALTTVLNVIGREMSSYLPQGWSTTVLQSLNFALSFGVIMFLFAAIYKVLPDVQISWRDVLIGAFATALLFVVGKELIGYYLGNSAIGSAYGVASSLAILLVWVYFSAIILFLGAEFTQAWAHGSGRSIMPDDSGVFIDEAASQVE